MDLETLVKEMRVEVNLLQGMKLSGFTGDLSEDEYALHEHREDELSWTHFNNPEYRFNFDPKNIANCVEVLKGIKDTSLQLSLGVWYLTSSTNGAGHYLGVLALNSGYLEIKNFWATEICGGVVIRH